MKNTKKNNGQTTWGEFEKELKKLTKKELVEYILIDKMVKDSAVYTVSYGSARHTQLNMRNDISWKGVWWLIRTILKEKFRF